MYVAVDPDAVVVALVVDEYSQVGLVAALLVYFVAVDQDFAVDSSLDSISLDFFYLELVCPASSNGLHYSAVGFPIGYCHVSLVFHSFVCLEHVRLSYSLPWQALERMLVCQKRSFLTS